MSSHLEIVEEPDWCEGCGHAVDAGLMPFSSDLDPREPPKTVCGVCLLGLDEALYKIWLLARGWVPGVMELVEVKARAKVSTSEVKVPTFRGECVLCGTPHRSGRVGTVCHRMGALDESPCVGMIEKVEEES